MRQTSIYDLSIKIADSEKATWYFHLLDARIKSSGKEHIWEGTRFTGVLERKDKDWKLMQTHVSIPESA